MWDDLPSLRLRRAFCCFEYQLSTKWRENDHSYLINGNTHCKDHEYIRKDDFKEQREEYIAVLCHDSCYHYCIDIREGSIVEIER